MKPSFDFIVVGGGSAGAVIASRLSEDPQCRVALLEAGSHPPPQSLIPAAVGDLENDPALDWMYSADCGDNVGMGLSGGRMPVPRGKMLGGCSGNNYMAYVRGHPGDFDAWAEAGASGWSYAEVLPYFKKSEAVQLNDAIAIDTTAHGEHGPMCVSVRQPVIPAAENFVKAANAIGIPKGDYNGCGRSEPSGVASLMQTTTRQGKRVSTYHAFLEGAVEQRENLTIITGAHATRLLFDTATSTPKAIGLEYKSTDGRLLQVLADKEVILSAGAVGSPQLLMLSGVGPQDELENLGINSLIDCPEVGRHLQDHIHFMMFFEAPGQGIPVGEIGLSFGPDALRGPDGPLPENPADDEHLPAELTALKQEAERRFSLWQQTGHGLISSSLYDAVAWYSTGLGDLHTQDAQLALIPSGLDLGSWQSGFPIDETKFFNDPEDSLAPDKESVMIFANPVQPHSEGQIRLTSADPAAEPDICMNYLSDPHDVTVAIAIVRRALELAKHWPEPLGRWHLPADLAEKHGYKEGDTPNDKLLEDFVRSYPGTVYHLTSTCRMGDVVDSDLRVIGVDNLRIADASVMPRIVSGNTNAAAIMIGEKAAEIVAREHGVHLQEFVGQQF